MKIPCPSPNELEALLEGQVDPTQAEQLSAHVDGCAECQVILENLTDATELSCTIRSRSSAGAEVLVHAEASAFLERVKSTAFSLRGASEADPLAPLHLPNIDGYEIIRELGRGGIGVVYLARQHSLNRLVALKVLRSGPYADQEERARFRHEAETVARLRHPNMVHVYEVGEQNGNPFLAMEFVEGGSLRDRLQGNPQPFANSVRLMEIIARAIHHAHLAGLIHRDLKPANILLQPSLDATSPKRLDLSECEPKITDFGLAKQLDDPNHRTATGEIVGTPSYMAPEQAASQRSSLGPATDVYSLGAILYELITGRPPFKGATAVDTVVQLLHQEVVRPSSLRPELPRDLETICMTCLNKDSARRYSSASALAHDLARFRRGQPIVARPIGPIERTWKWARSHPLPTALLLGIFLVATLGFAGVTWQWREAVLAGRRYLEERVQKEAERELAETARAETAIQRREARQALYGSRIAQSQLSWRVSDLPGARRALESCIPIPGDEDRRGWEWYYLRQLYRSERLLLEHNIDGVAGALAHSVKGDRLASIVANTEQGAEGELILWQPLHNRQIWRQTLPGQFHRLTFSPTGNLLALASMDGWVMLYDTVANREIKRWKAHESDISAIAYSGDGRLMLTSSWDQKLRLWSPREGKLLRTLEGHTGRIHTACFIPQSKFLASASWDQTVRIWPHAGGSPRILEGHKSPVFALAASPDGKYLASGSEDGQVRIWEVATGRVVQSFTAVTGAIFHLAFSPDGRSLAYSSSDAAIHVWDIDSGTHKANYRGHTATIEGLSFHPNGETLVSCCPREGALVVWDMTRNPESARFAQADSSIRGFACTPQGEQLLTLTVRGQLQFWSRSTGVPTREHALLDPSLGPTKVNAAAFSEDGQWLATSASEDTRVIQLWETKTGQRIANWTIAGQVRCLAFSPEKTRLAIGGTTEGKAFLRVLRLPDGKTIREIDLPVRPEAVLFRDEDALAWGGERGRLGLAYLPTGEHHSARVHRGSVYALAFHPHKPHLASTGEGDRQIRLSETRFSATERPVRIEMGLLESPTEVTGLAYSPDGKRLAAVSRNVVKLWDTKTRLEMLTLRGANRPFWEDSLPLLVQFSPDGQGLMATNSDDTLSLWEAEPPGGETPAETPPSFVSPERSAFWHLSEAEQSLRFKNRNAAQFHVSQVEPTLELPPPLLSRREWLLHRLAEAP